MRMQQPICVKTPGKGEESKGRHCLNNSQSREKDKYQYIQDMSVIIKPK